MNKNITDHIGMVTSCVCIIHCLLLPFLLLFTSFTDFEQFHGYTLGLTVLISGHALWHGWKRHCKHIVMWFGTIGVLCLVGGVIAHEFAHGHTTMVAHGDHFHAVHSHNNLAKLAEVAITVIGSLFIIMAHLYNLKFKKSCTCK